jgi:hypothetical protein
MLVCDGSHLYAILAFFLILSAQRCFYEIRDDRFRFSFHVVVHARLRWQPWWRQNG